MDSSSKSKFHPNSSFISKNGSAGIVSKFEHMKGDRNLIPNMLSRPSNPPQLNLIPFIAMHSPSNFPVEFYNYFPQGLILTDISAEAWHDLLSGTLNSKVEEKIMVLQANVIENHGMET